MRDFKNLTTEDAEKSGWNILVPLEGCVVVGKAVLDETDITIMKVTKRFPVPGGWIYNTSTEVHKDGRVSVAEAMAFVPETSSRS